MRLVDVVQDQGAQGSSRPKARSTRGGDLLTVEHSFHRRKALAIHANHPKDTLKHRHLSLVYDISRAIGSVCEAVARFAASNDLSLPRLAELAHPRSSG